MRLLNITIESFEIEFKLSKILGLKFIDLEFKSNKALKFAVKKEQVDEEITVADLKAIFLP